MTENYRVFVNSRNLLLEVGVSGAEFEPSIESRVEAAWDASDRQSGCWEMPSDLAALLLPGVASRLSAEVVGKILRLNNCNTLVELIERIGGTVSF